MFHYPGDIRNRIRDNCRSGRKALIMSLFRLTYETVSETVVVQEASTDLDDYSGRTYETVIRYRSGPSQRRVEYISIPACLRKQCTETVVVQDASTELVTIPATLRNCDQIQSWFTPQSVDYVSPFRPFTKQYLKL